MIKMETKIIVIEISGEENQTRNLLISQQLLLPNAMCGYDVILLTEKSDAEKLKTIRGKLLMLIDKYEDE